MHRPLNVKCILLLFRGTMPEIGLRPPLCEVFRLHTHTHTHTQPVGLLWMSDQLVAESATNTTQTQETNIHALSGIRTRDHSSWVSLDQRLIPHAHRERRNIYLFFVIYTILWGNVTSGSQCSEYQYYGLPVILLYNLLGDRNTSLSEKRTNSIS
jgi:hypothetical protein